MTSANLILASGTKITIEGSADEVSTVLSRFEGRVKNDRSGTPDSSIAEKAKQKLTKFPKAKVGGPQKLIAELVSNDFFVSKRTISAVQAKLEEAGHIYQLQRLSTPLLRLTRGKQLRRLKESSGWVYVNY